MARVAIHLFLEEDGNVPFLDWFGDLPDKAQDKCRVRLERLQELSNELRRPEADFLRDEVYELRVKHHRINYRILYFFHERSVVVISHGIQKERAVPPKEIELAIVRKKRYTADPGRHTAMEEIP